MNWSHYQLDIFQVGLETEDSLLIEAVAGSGKSTVLEELLVRMWQQRPGLRAIFVAFGKEIASSMNARLKRRGLPEMASTLHSVGLQTWKRSLEWDSNLCEVKFDKTFNIMKEVMSWKERERWGESTRRLVGLGKQVGIVPGYSSSDPANSNYFGLVNDSESEWEALCDHYGIEFEEVNLELVRKVLARGIEIGREQVDFDDMLYLPVVSGVQFDQWDVVFVDEAQDLSGIQIEMIERMVKT